MHEAPPTTAAAPTIAPAVASIRQRAVRGSLWTFGGLMASQGMRVGANIALAWLLAPQLFGLMQIVNALNRGLLMLSETGIRSFIVQSDDAHDERALNTAWVIQIARGIVIFLAMAALGYPVARFYGDDRFVYLLPVVGLASLLTGPRSIMLFVQEKRIDLRRLTVYDVVCQMIGIAAMVVWAVIDPTVWALAGGGVIGALAKLVLSFVMIPGHRHSFQFDRAFAKKMYHFGKWITLSAAFTFLAMQSDRLLLGKLASLTAVGIYGQAFGLVQILRDSMQRLSARVLLPVLSEKKKLPREVFAQKIDSFRRPASFACIVPVALLATFGDKLVLVLFDDRWIEAGPVLMVLSIGVWPMLLNIAFGRALTALGHPQYNAHASLVRFVLIAAALPIGYVQAGLVGASIAVACADIPIYLVIARGRYKHRLGGFRTDLYSTLALGLAIGVLWLLR